jgi:NDP-sugar pyrophosphorylase family protein
VATDSVAVPELREVDVFLLCGGLGTRLRTTAAAPKSLAPIAGRPFLEHLIAWLAREGARRFVLCTGFGAEAVAEFAPRLRAYGEVVLSREVEPLGTGGALRRALDHARSEHFLATNGDSWAPIDLRALIAFHTAEAADYTLAVAPPGRGEEVGSVQIDSAARIRAFHEKQAPGGAYRSAGVYAFRRTFFERAAPAGAFSLEHDFFARAPEHRAFAFVQPADFVDIGTPERYAGAERRLRELALLPAEVAG